MTLGEATEVYRKRQEDLDTTIDEMSRYYYYYY